MELKPCRACGRSVATDAEKCPNCGKPLRMTPVQRVMILVFFLLGMYFVMQALIASATYH